MNKSYIVTFDKGGLFDGFNYTIFHNKLTQAKGIVTWWHHLEGTYILIVNWNISATSISKYIKSIAPNKKHFVCAIDLNDYYGWLDQKAWDSLQSINPSSSLF